MTSHSAAVEISGPSTTEFGADSTAEEVAATLASHITGKNVIVTGTTLGGIGGEAARVLAKYANLVIITGRTKEKLEETKETIKKEIPAANVRPLVMDLASLTSVRKAAAEVNAYTENIHVIIHNAGLMATPYEPTEDGFEPQMAVNHYAPFLFTALIFPKLRAAGTPSDPARIVNVSSVGHAYSPIRFDDLDFEGGKSYNKWLAYGQSKTAPILFSNEIARRAKDAGVPVVSYSVHPGAIGGTALMRAVEMEELKATGMVNEQGELTVVLKPVGKGAATYLVAGFDPAVLPHSGAYLEDGDIHEERRQAHARPQEFGEKLWTISEDAVKEKFVI